MLFFLFFTSVTFAANESVYDKGVTAFESGEHEKAIQLFTDAANKGNADAQHVLGLIFFRGTEVPQDYKVASKWFALSAEQGNKDAQYNLGVMYFDGLGVNQDYKNAINWFTKSAEQGFVEAQYILGFIYNEGW